MKIFCPSNNTEVSVEDCLFCAKKYNYCGILPAYIYAAVAEYLRPHSFTTVTNVIYCIRRAQIMKRCDDKITVDFRKYFQMIKGSAMHSYLTEKAKKNKLIMLSEKKLIKKIWINLDRIRTIDEALNESRVQVRNPNITFDKPATFNYGIISCQDNIAIKEEVKMLVDVVARPDMVSKINKKIILWEIKNKGYLKIYPADILQMLYYKWILEDSLTEKGKTVNIKIDEVKLYDVPSAISWIYNTKELDLSRISLESEYPGITNWESFVEKQFTSLVSEKYAPRIKQYPKEGLCFNCWVKNICETDL